MFRRALLVLTAAVLGAGSVVAFPGTAHAAEHAVTPGTPVTIDLTVGSTESLVYTLPPGKRPTLTVSALTLGVDADQLSFSFKRASFDGDPERWYADFDANPGPDPITDVILLRPRTSFEPVTTGQITLTLGLADDTAVDVVSGEATTLTFPSPGDRALLRFDAAAADNIHVQVTEDGLNGPPNGLTSFRRYLVYQIFDFGRGGSMDDDPQFSGDFPPFTPGIDGTITLAVDPELERTGTLTVLVTVTPGTTGFLGYGQSTQVNFDRPGRTRRYALTADDTGGTVVKLFTPSFSTPDGSVGSATFQLTAGTSVTTGTISGDQTLLSVPAGTLPAGDALLTVTSGAGTTGTVQLSVQFDNGPPTPLQPGANPVRLAPTAHGSAYSFDADADQRFEVYLQSPVFDTSQGGGAVVVYLTDPFGLRTFLGFVDPDFGQQFDNPAFTVPFAGTWSIELGRFDGQPVPGSGLEASLFLVRPTATRLDRTLPVDERVTFAAPGDSVDVTFPGRTGQIVVARLIDPSFTAPAGEPQPASAAIRFDGAFDENFSTVTAGAGELYLESVPLDFDHDVRVSFDPERLATGSARLVLRVPQDTSGALAPIGTPTVVPIPEAGARAHFTFDGTVGQSVGFDVPAITLAGDPNGPAAVTFTIRGPSGFPIGGGTGTAGSPSFVDLQGPLTETGTYTLDVDVRGRATGSLTVTRVVPKVTTTPVLSGQRRTLTFGRGDVHRLTFSGRTGQHPVLRLSQQTLTGPVLATLLNPAGEVMDIAFAQPDSPLLKEFLQLPANGTYSVVLDPFGADVGSLSARVDLVTDPVRSIAPGATVRATVGVAENPVYRFSVRKGERVAVDLRGGTASPGGFITVELRDPSGNVVAQSGVSEGSGPSWIEAPEPVTSGGTWSVVLDGFDVSTGSATFVVRTAADQVLNNRVGRSTTVTISSPVQNAVLPFTVPGDGVEHTVSWTVTGSTFADAQLLLVNPGGATIDGGPLPVGNSSGSFFLFRLSSPATFKLMVNPLQGSTGKVTIRFTVT